MAEGEAWPAGRADLFRGFVARLLARERRKGHADWPGEAVLSAALTRLAEGMQTIGEGTRLPRPEALERLPVRVEAPDGVVDTAPKVLLRLGLAAILLDTELDPAAGEQIRFYHHQLQEYFAARALLDAFRRGEDLRARWRCPRLKGEMPDPGPLRDDEPLPPPHTTGWEEPTLMAAGLPGAGADFLAAVRAVNPALAARCLSEPGVASAPEERVATRRALLGDMESPEVHLRARLAAGRVLARLGDSRFTAFEPDGVRVLLPPLAEIPAGEVDLGSSWFEAWRLSRRGFPAGHERPRHRLRLPRFAIGRYPVTHAEFDCFVADGGYGEECWWDTRQDRAWRRGELRAGYVDDRLNTWRTLKADPSIMARQGWSEYNIAQWRKLLEMEEDEIRALVEKLGADRPMDRPAYWTDERFDNPSQPVVGVTWFEARAYCNWLTGRWREVGEEAPRRLPENARLRLPTEAEWERAARLSSGRRFPWGDRWQADCANTAEGRVLTTTPVGIYPGGTNPAGVQDLAGNVWEWCESLYRDYPIRPGDGRDEAEAAGHRVVRGGSWDDAQWVARCASRGRLGPDVFYNDLGFRLVLSLADSEC